MATPINQSVVKAFAVLKCFQRPDEWLTNCELSRRAGLPEASGYRLLQTLERYGVKAVDTSDGKFDPNLHQAIAEVPGNGKPPGSIVDVVQSGFTIGDRLLRPAMVTVAKKDVPAQPAGVDTKA